LGDEAIPELQEPPHKSKNHILPKSLSSGSHLALMMSPVSERITVGLILTIDPISFSRPSIFIILFLFYSFSIPFIGSTRDIPDTVWNIWYHNLHVGFQLFLANHSFCCAAGILSEIDALIHS
jgi:hypothetical protein